MISEWWADREKEVADHQAEIKARKAARREATAQRKEARRAAAAQRAAWKRFVKMVQRKVKQRPADEVRSGRYMATDPREKGYFSVRWVRWAR